VNAGEFSVKNNRIVLVAAFFIVLGGIGAYIRLGRLEDPEFTIKQALIITPYPGASAEEVAQEVTNPIESAVQQLGQLDRVESESLRGRSVVSAMIKDEFHADAIPQVWDELRRKVGDVQSRLPPAVRGRSIVVDDFGDVYGVFLAISGDGFSQPELRRYAEFLRRELQTVQDVKKVDLFAEQQEVVFLEMSRQRLAQLGIDEEQIYSQLQARNVAADGGRVRVGDEYPAIDPQGGFQSADEMLVRRSDASPNQPEACGPRCGPKAAPPPIGPSWSVADERRAVISSQRLRLEAVELGAVDAAGVEQGLRLRDLVGRCRRGAGDGADVRIELLLCRPHRLRRARSHPAAADDQVGEHADDRKDQDEHDPQRLGHAGDLVVAEQVRGDRHQEPEPADEEEDLEEPDQHRAMTER
jgi:multidrug efflux pump subunit AcrB